ncbi:MAG TPA: hypothetical protein VHP33_13845 [Polyangiaceae bacterium]|nr:hypothetical protein [Polyangiaceae bacterium]
MSRSRLVQRSLLIGGLWVAACAPPPPAPPKPAPAPPASHAPAPVQPAQLTEEAEPSVSAELRSGRIQPIDHEAPLQLKVRRHAIDGDEQLLELVLPEFAAEVPGDSFWLGTEARISGGSAPFQLISRGKGAEMVLWLRRPKGELAAEIMGDAYTPALGAQPGHHFRFRAAAPTGAVAADLPAQWATAAVNYLSNEGGVFGTSAAARLHARYKLTTPLNTGWGGGYYGAGGELGDLMDTFAGRSAVQAALATHRGSVLSLSKQPRKLPIAQLKPPELQRHPWAELSKRLSAKAPEEPLAKAVPADFYFVRARSFSAFTEVLGFVEQFGAPAADLADGAASERGTLPRYLAELGVETSDLSRVLGPEVVQDFALTGSDPYVHEGTDLTLIFRLKSPLLFRAALLKALASHGAAHGGTQPSNFTHEGVAVEVARSADGRVRQHHAVVGDLELVSNSAAAVKRVISTIQGKAPKLADEPDFQYMLARDADVPADLLAFIGDRFVETVVGPAQKIAEARRQVALSELTAAPIAALLYGWVHGKSPSDKNELVRSGLLAAGELSHIGGGRIEWAPGVAPRSSFGTPAALEPLIEQPPVTQVSVAERDSYASFASSYQNYWSQYIDPIALRLSSARRGEGKGLHAELRVLPLVPAEAAMRFDLGGDGRVAPSELSSGARFAMGIGADAPLRRELSGLARWASGGGRGITLDWLGDYAMVGVADRAELLAAARSSRETREMPIERPASAEERGREDGPRDEMEMLAGLPVYAVVGLKSRVATAVALAAVRHMVVDAGSDAIQWAPFASYRGVEVVRVLGRDNSHEVALYYAFAGDALLLTLNRTVMRSLIEQALDGKFPLQDKAALKARAGKNDGQVVVELAPSKKGSLRTLLTWALSVAAQEGSGRARAAAEAVLRGVPESAHKPERSAELLRAYLGSAPLTPDGRRYWLAPEGISDPLRGSSHAPEWPALPTPGSSAEKLLSAVSRVRSDLSFDEEPQLSTSTPRLRSLRARLDLWLR